MSIYDSWNGTNNKPIKIPATFPVRRYTVCSHGHSFGVPELTHRRLYLPYQENKSALCHRLLAAQN